MCRIFAPGACVSYVRECMPAIVRAFVNACLYVTLCACGCASTCTCVRQGVMRSSNVEAYPTAVPFISRNNLVSPSLLLPEQCPSPLNLVNTVASACSTCSDVDVHAHSHALRISPQCAHDACNRQALRTVIASFAFSNLSRSTGCPMT